MIHHIVSEALERYCDEKPSQQSLDTAITTIQDKEVMEMIGVFYMMYYFFFPYPNLIKEQGITWKLKIDDLVNLIKNRNNDSYANLTSGICNAMNELLDGCSPGDAKRLPDSCQVRKWSTIGRAWEGRKCERDVHSVGENEALMIYHKMVEDADDIPKPSLGMRVGKKLTHPFDRLRRIMG